MAELKFIVVPLVFGRGRWAYLLVESLNAGETVLEKHNQSNLSKLP